MRRRDSGAGLWMLKFISALLIALACSSPAAFAVERKTHQLSGVAAYYDRHYSGRTTSGARYDPNRLTAAHRTLPFGTHVRVTDRRTGRTVEVVITDRGPFNKGRVIDLSLAAAKELRMIERGLARVSASVISNK
jgi:peptidoglycan lytic transglycosylase